MGLAAAYEALKEGHDVTLLEAAPEPGGMAAHFDFGGLSIERYYHFICKADRPTFELLEELGLADKLRWRETSMGYFLEGTLHPWGDPVSLLRFPALGLIDKVRYGLLMFISTKLKDWPSLETRSAKDWIEGWCGKRVYEKLWRRLFDLKFYQYADNISAAWIWTRIKRVGTSRKSLLQEEMGYIEGGSQTLVDALVEKIEALGGDLRLSEPVEQILERDGRVAGLKTKRGEEPFDAVISTAPTPYVPAMLPPGHESLGERYKAILNIGVVCVVLKLKRSVTPHFWVNVCDPDLPIPGIIEFSNLRPTEEVVVYVPYYMPSENPLWKRSDEVFVEESLDCLKAINPEIGSESLIGSYVGRLKHAQPVCEPGFAAKIPPVETEIAGLQIADTCFYYPEDRGIAESVRLGREMARRIGT
jgi:protoporphyrinogen oxidase